LSRPLVVAVRKQLREFALEAATEIPNGVTVVVGASGSGKTTLLRLIAGLLRPDSGRIILDGRVLVDERTYVPPFQRNIAMVFQEYALFPHLTVAQNVAFGLRARSVPAAERDPRVARMLERMEIGKLGAERVDKLSGGQRQRVALGRALVVEPAAVLLDEPLSALDPSTRARVRAELAALLHDVDVPTLFVTHDEADRAAFPDRAIYLDAGKLVP
jgi:ABC-type sulfate/molybdate transport systems ATPase subunit